MFDLYKNIVSKIFGKFENQIGFCEREKSKVLMFNNLYGISNNQIGYDDMNDPEFDEKNNILLNDELIKIYKELCNAQKSLINELKSVINLKDELIELYKKRLALENIDDIQ